MRTEQQIAEARRDTIGDALRRAAACHRDRIALGFGERRWSYAALDQAADRIAQRLLGAGLGRGDRVVAFGRNSDAYLLGWLGCVRAGLVHVPANYALNAEELGYIARQSGAAAILYQPALAATAEAVREGLGLRLGATIDAGHEADGLPDLLATATDRRWDPPAGTDLAAALDENDLVQIIYTSGTTAAPKGAMMTHRAQLAEYLSCIQALDFSAGDRGLAALPLYHTAQMHAFCMPQLLVGSYTRLIEAPDPALVLRLIEEERLTSFFAPPTVWIGLLRHPDFDRRDLGSLRRAYYGAAIMPLPVLEELQRRLPSAGLYNCYGQSEIGPLATVLRPEEHAARPSSVGRPVLLVQTRVVDGDMRDVPPGERGEIVHRSPQLLLGYWDKPAETAAAFAGGWFHSGDVGTMDAEGYIAVVDRVKDVINTGGVLVASREVEDALFSHPAVAEVAVIALPDPKWIEAIAAIVVLRDGAELDVGMAEETLIAHARDRLAPYKLPKRVILAESLPKNPSGKLLKRELRARYGGRADAVPGVG